MKGTGRLGQVRWYEGDREVRTGEVVWRLGQVRWYEGDREVRAGEVV